MDPFELLIEAHRPGLKAALARLVDVLRAHDVRYVIGGANALSLYVRPRATIDIDAFVDLSHKERLDKTLATEFEVVNIGRYHSKFRQGDVEIDILYAGAPADDYALASARDAVILGAKLKAPSPEALVWLYLVSDEPRHYADAVEILRALPALDITRLRKELARKQPELIAKLEKLQTTAREPIASYEESRSRRKQ
jgi:hypothetical protein